MKEKTWQFEESGIDGMVELFGVNIFEQKWVRTGEYADVEDPNYLIPKRFNIYITNIDGKEYTFAAGEFSNCVWGFYTLK